MGQAKPNHLKRSLKLAKTLTKQTFLPPSEAVLLNIAASDKSHGLQAATFRFEARMAELDKQYSAKASEIRAAYVAECSEVATED